MNIIAFNLDFFIGSFGNYKTGLIRTTDTEPSKSLVDGILKNAMGIDKYENRNLGFKFAYVVTRRGERFIDEQNYHYDEKDCEIYKENKFNENEQIITNPRKMCNKRIKKEYLTDFKCIAFIYLEYLDDLIDALKHPKRPLYAGRKSCPLSRIHVEKISGETIKEIFEKFRNLHPNNNRGKPIFVGWEPPFQPGYGGEIKDRYRRDENRKVYLTDANSYYDYDKKGSNKKRKGKEECISYKAEHITYDRRCEYYIDSIENLVYMTCYDVKNSEPLHSQMNGKQFLNIGNKNIRYTDKPIDSGSTLMSIKKGDKHKFIFPMAMAQAEKENGRLHDIITHKKMIGEDVSGKESEIRLDFFKEKFGEECRFDMGCEFPLLEISSYGLEIDEFYNGKTIRISYCVVRGELIVKDPDKFKNILLNGYGKGKSYGIGRPYIY